DAASALVLQEDGGFLFSFFGTYLLVYVNLEFRRKPMSLSEASLSRSYTYELPQRIGQRVQLQGWLHAIRFLGGVSFLILRDGWGTAQVIVETAAQLAPLQAANAMPESVL